MRARLVRIAVAAVALCAIDALAVQIQRTFVASNGSDANPCSLAFPCRSFNAAIAQTLAGGEVVILDTAGYGPMTINKAIKIIGPSGVYGGISVVGNGGPTTGITISAGATDVVILRGLDISGVPAPPFSALPDIGIDIQNAGAVHIEKTSIGNFTQDTSSCIHMDTANAIRVYVVDSFLRECRNGVAMNGTGPDNTTRPSVEIDNTRIERMLNTAAVGTTGLNLTGNFAATLRNSIIANAGDGIFADNTVATAKSRAYVIHSNITNIGNAAIETSASSNNLSIDVSNSVLSLNFAALLLGHGSVLFSANVITHNQNSLANCGGNPANVVSLGYSASVGSNLIANNADSAFPPGCTAYITPTIVVAQ